MAQTVNFTLTINSSDDSFQEDAASAIGDMLVHLGNKIRNECGNCTAATGGKLFDVNGNSVGRFDFSIVDNED